MNDIRPCGNNEKWCENCVSKGKCNYTKNQGIIAELEKIKAEIQILSFFSRPYNMQMVEMSNVVERIDNHISKLKGEQE